MKTKSIPDFLLKFAVSVYLAKDGDPLGLVEKLFDTKVTVTLSIYEKQALVSKSIIYDSKTGNVYRIFNRVISQDYGIVPYFNRTYHVKASNFYTLSNYSYPLKWKGSTFFGSEYISDFIFDYTYTLTTGKINPNTKHGIIFAK